MGTIQILFIVWGVITAVLIIMMIYRSMLETHEDDQIFIDAAEASNARDQRSIVARIEKLSMPITLLMIASGALLVVIAGVWLWRGFHNF
jgi:hypothetical protein